MYINIYKYMYMYISDRTYQNQKRNNNTTNNNKKMMKFNTIRNESTTSTGSTTTTDCNCCCKRRQREIVVLPVVVPPLHYQQRKNRIYNSIYKYNFYSCMSLLQVFLLLCIQCYYSTIPINCYHHRHQSYYGIINSKNNKYRNNKSYSRTKPSSSSSSSSLLVLSVVSVGIQNKEQLLRHRLVRYLRRSEEIQRKQQNDIILQKQRRIQYGLQQQQSSYTTNNNNINQNYSLLYKNSNSNILHFTIVILRQCLQSTSIGFVNLLRPSNAIASSTSLSSSTVSLPKKRNWKPQQQQQKDGIVDNNNNNELLLNNHQQQLSYDDLTIFGKVVAGSMEIVFTTLLEYISGFVGGYFLGCITGIPSFFITSSSTTGAGSSASKLLNNNNNIINNKIIQSIQELGLRTNRIHTKSFTWARKWGTLSATFGCCRISVKVLRSTFGNKNLAIVNDKDDDEWNTIISSFIAGAFFARKDGITAMIRGAVVYGGLMYLLSGKSTILSSSSSNQKQQRQLKQFDFHDEPIDF